MSQITSEQRNTLKQEAFPLLPQALESPEGQKQLQEMLCALVPPVELCRKKAEQELWPKVDAGTMELKQAIAQCAYDADRIIGITRMESLQLEQKDRTSLLKAWIVLEYYRYVLMEDYSIHIRQLQEQLSQLLQPEQAVMEEEIPGLPPISIPALQQEQIPPQGIPVPVPPKQKKLPIALILGAAAAVLVIVLVCCYLLSPVTKTEKAIAAIGTVTLESEDLIEAAEALYDGLKESQQEKVENAVILTEARTEFDTLKKALDDAIEAIDAIGTVTMESGDQIKAARAAYDKLKTMGLTSRAEHRLPILTQAEEDYEALYVQILYASAQEQQAAGSHQEALDAYRAIWETYPDAECVPDCKTRAMDCTAALALSEIKAGNLETAMKLLTDVETLCDHTEGYTKANAALEQKLKQLRPTNGRTFKNTLDWGWGEFTVTADSDRDAYVKLVSIVDPSKYVTFYVHAGQSATVKVKDGSYIVKYTTGENWFGPEAMFGENAAFTKADDTFTFNTTISGSYVHYSNISITLYSVVGGDLSTTPITADSF